MSGPVPPKRVFRFSVDKAGKFTYDPPQGWHYFRPETVRFECQTANSTEFTNFTINFIPITIPPAPDYGLIGPITSEQSDGAHIVETTVHDDLDDATREAIRQANISPTEPDGFMGHVRYAIAVRDSLGRIMFTDETHNGQYKC